MDGLKEKLSAFYGANEPALERQTLRWRGLTDRFREKFGERERHLFSAPGRTEIGGNHTDHNNGKVVSAAIDLDSIAVAAKSDQRVVRISSDGYPEEFVVPLDSLSPVAGERGLTTALIRGIVSRLGQLGFTIEGFDACMTSDVMVGSGLSSSASVEMLIATIINHLFNDGKADPVTLAQAGQFAENAYFGKPCGLMDQLTCAVGGIVKIDFKDPKKPNVEKVDVNFQSSGYSMLVVDTGGNHAGLDDEYASIPREMKSVAVFFRKETCRDITKHDLLKSISRLRPAVGDRAILRALHFAEENERVELEASSLRKGDIQTFLQLVNESGRSSVQLLQNCYTTGLSSPSPTKPRHPAEQGVMIGLALTEQFIRKIGSGACRVHGGGFAGTMLAFLPRERVKEYIPYIESSFAPGSVKELRVRSIGTTCIE